MHFSVKSTKFLITYYKDLKSGTQTETAFRHLRSETQQATKVSHTIKYKIIPLKSVVYNDR
ncbi:hypothetical protein NEIFL0001_0419 [Neisseria flavescens SK114]|nr:hypothetical protein NEIFL0001_0419 [Neisseria flavescens SK114]